MHKSRFTEEQIVGILQEYVCSGRPDAGYRPVSSHSNYVVESQVKENPVAGQMGEAM